MPYQTIPHQISPTRLYYSIPDHVIAHLIVSFAILYLSISHPTIPYHTIRYLPLPFKNVPVEQTNFDITLCFLNKPTNKATCRIQSVSLGIFFYIHVHRLSVYTTIGMYHILCARYVRNTTWAETGTGTGPWC